MDAHYTDELPQAFVIGEDELKRLSNLLSERIGTLDIQADCADNVARTFKNIKDLTGFDNARGRQIRRLRLSARSDDFKKRATINLSGSRWQGISLNFEARDDVVARLRAETLSIIEGMRPWYARLHRVDFVSTALFGYILLSIGALLAVAFKWVNVSDSKESNPRSSAIAQLVIYGGIAFLITGGVLLNRFRDSIFPRAVFLIGQGKGRFQHLERVQWGIVIAFIVSLLAGLIIVVWQTIAA